MPPPPSWHPLRNETLIEQLGGISEDLRLALQAARSLALDLGCDQLGGEHLLYGLACGDSPAARRLQDLGLDLSALRSYAESRKNEPPFGHHERLPSQPTDPLDWLDPGLSALNPSGDAPLESEALDAAVLLSQILPTRPVRDALRFLNIDPRDLSRPASEG